MKIMTWIWTFGFDFKGFRTGELEEEDSDSGLGLVNKALPFFMTWYIC